jgi:hypothetical protein
MLVSFQYASWRLKPRLRAFGHNVRLRGRAAALVKWNLRRQVS